VLCACSSLVRIFTFAASACSSFSTVFSHHFLMVKRTPSALTFRAGKLNSLLLPLMWLTAMVPRRSATVKYSIMSVGCNVKHEATKSPSGEAERPHVLAFAEVHLAFLDLALPVWLRGGCKTIGCDFDSCGRVACGAHDGGEVKCS
jgi:hypothetical protein